MRSKIAKYCRDTRRRLRPRILNVIMIFLQEAVLKLMQPKLHVPSDHPLLTYEYPENDAWNAKEIEIFQQAILKFDKNFSRIAQHVSNF